MNIILNFFILFIFNFFLHFLFFVLLSRAMGRPTGLCVVDASQNKLTHLFRSLGQLGPFKLWAFCGVGRSIYPTLLVIILKKKKILYFQLQQNLNQSFFYLNIFVLIIFLVFGIHSCHVQGIWFWSLSADFVPKMLMWLIEFYLALSHEIMMP